VVSAMAEHGIAGPAIGIAYDGGGYGADGTVWGGEVMLATPFAYRRVATFRPLPLIGGDAAVRAPWRLALALVHDAFDGVVPAAVRARFTRIPPRDFEAAQRMLGRPIDLPHARGVGRYFDAFGSLFLGRAHVRFEGQAALEWNQAADPRVSRSYPFDLAVGVNRNTTVADAQVLEIDLRPAVRAAVADFADHLGVETIAAAFHNTIAAATSAIVRTVADAADAMPIVASGGCFQNALLAERVRAMLAPEHDVLFQRIVPPGDGGIALGQAVIANAVARGQSESGPCV